MTETKCFPDQLHEFVGQPNILKKIIDIKLL